MVPLMSTSTHSEIDHFNFPRRIQKIIGVKRRRLLKKSLLAGRQNAAKRGEPFLANLHNAMKIYHAAKIASIIDNAESMVQEHLQKIPTAIVAMALKLLKNIAEHTDVEVTASTKDAEILKASDSLLSSSARKVTIIGDDTFKRGSLVIKANKSIIDAHLSTQLCKAKEILELHS